MGFSEERSIEQPALKVFGELGYEIVDLFDEKVGLVTLRKRN